MNEVWGGGFEELLERVSFLNLFSCCLISFEEIFTLGGQPIMTIATRKIDRFSFIGSR